MSAVPAPPSTFYFCPGERHPISRSVHWARLAASYEKCRSCEYRHDAGLVPISRLSRDPQSRQSLVHTLEFTPEGIRGRYLNDLDRQTASKWTAAFAAWLWDRRPLAGRLSDRPDGRSAAALPSGPRVVVGFDERPSSPDLAVGVVTAFRQMGCHVIDIGLSTKPLWRFAAEQSQAAGVLVTGAGWEPAWSGLDLLGSDGNSISPEELQPLLDPPPLRPTRSAGQTESRVIFEEYVASLPEHFHALRPLNIVCATPLETLRFLLPRLFANLPCTLHCATWPRQRRVSPPAGAERIGNLVRQHAADLGFLIDEDGCTCDVWDEMGHFVPASAWQDWLKRVSPEAGCDRDGVVTLGKLLQALSLSDAPASEQWCREP